MILALSAGRMSCSQKIAEERGSGWPFLRRGWPRLREAAWIPTFEAISLTKLCLEGFLPFVFRGGQWGPPRQVSPVPAPRFPRGAKLS